MLILMMVMVTALQLICNSICGVICLEMLMQAETGYYCIVEHDYLLMIEKLTNKPIHPSILLKTLAQPQNSSKPYTTV